MTIRIQPIQNERYEKERNKLIPIAEQFANDEVGEGSRGISREKWVKAWNLCFLTKMDSLARENGLLN